MLLVHEGGFVNDPADTGGMTNLGVTAREWQAYSGEAASETTMRHLTPEMVKPLYKAHYWDKISGDALPAGVDWAVFDFCVNSGPSRAASFLQKVLDVTADGQIGPDTIHAAQAASDVEKVIDDLCDARARFDRGLNNFDRFGRGWLARIEDVRKQAKEMVR